MSIVKCVAILGEDKYENITDNGCYFAEIFVKYWGFFCPDIKFCSIDEY